MNDLGFEGFRHETDVCFVKLSPLPHSEVNYQKDLVDLKYHTVAHVVCQVCFFPHLYVKTKKFYAKIISCKRKGRKLKRCT